MGDEDGLADEERAQVRQRGEDEAAHGGVQRETVVCLRGALGPRQAGHPGDHHEEGQPGELSLALISSNFTPYLRYAG